MQGSVSIGKDVLQMMSHYLRRAEETRRSGLQLDNENISAKINRYLKSKNVCRDGLKICASPTMAAFIRDYVSFLANAIENVFDGILIKRVDGGHEEIEKITFVHNLKPLLSDLRAVVKAANIRFTENSDQSEYISLLKRITAKFQNAAIAFVNEKLSENQNDLPAVRKKLIQKLVLATILIENRYERILCADYTICEEEHEVTKALHSLLGEFLAASKRKAMEFIKLFYENLSEHIFSFLALDTLHELQVILSDMSYHKESPAKDVLTSVFRVVDKRLRALKDEVDMPKAYDQQLVYVILSDMDFIYMTKMKMYPFENFLGVFSTWVKHGGKFNQQMRHIISELEKKLNTQAPELTEKLTNQVKVFLELTVDLNE